MISGTTLNILRSVWQVFLTHSHLLGLGKFSSILISWKAKKIAFSPYPFRMREVLDSLLSNRLITDSLPPIEIAIPSRAKDFPLLGLVLEGVRSHTLNPIGRVSIICPPADISALKALNLGNVNVVNEELLLGSSLASACDAVAPISHKGWVRQQAIKLSFVLQSDFKGVLILDSDTVLLKSQTWLESSGRQALSISLEYHKPYQNHLEGFLRSKDLGEHPFAKTKLHVSFVTHHQLMQPDILKKFLSGGNYPSPEKGLIKWIEQFDFSDSMSPGCEYHCYGTFLKVFFARRVRLVKWGNKAVSRDKIMKAYNQDLDEITLLQLKNIFPLENSISMHSYL